MHDLKHAFLKWRLVGMVKRVATELEMEYFDSNLFATVVTQEMRKLITGTELQKLRNSLLAKE